MRSSITFLESPATDLAHAMATNINMLFPEGRANGRVIFMYDVKSWNDRSTEQRDPWKNLPTLDEAHLQKVVTATLSQESQIFQGNDMFFVWDGRRLDSGKKIKKFINSQKGNPAMNKKKPLGPMFRLLYDNSEFQPKVGYACSQRPKFRSLADPLETVYSVFGSEVSLPERGRQHLEVTGTSRSLAISDLKLRSAEQHGIKLTGTSYQAMQQGMKISAPVPADDSEAPEEEEGAAEEDPVHEGPVVWYPWTACVPWFH